MVKKLSRWGLLAVVLVAMLGGVAVADSPAWQCWGPGLPDPCRNALHDIAIDPTQGRIWAVGDAGTILYWDGASWLKQQSPLAKPLRGVAAEGAQKAWAVGLEGTVLRYQGGTWTKSGPATSYWFRAVALVPGANGHAWAVADMAGIGSFYYWNGSNWSNRYAGKYQNLAGTIWDMSLLGAENGWAVGSALGSTGTGIGWVGQLMRLDSGGWSSQGTVPQELYGVALRTASDGWAVGKQGAIYRWDGSAWTQCPSPTEATLRDVYVVSANDAWAVGDDGTILRWNGSAWVAVPSPVRYPLLAVALSGPSSGWAVGEGGTVLRWDGAGWTTRYAPLLGRLDNICMTPGTGGRDGWAVGNARTMLRWDGLDWRPMSGPATSYNDIAMSSPNHGWLSAIGRRMCQWDGAAWTCVQLGDSALTLAAVGANNFWAGGWGTLQQWDGHAWTKVTSPTNRTLYDMEARTASDIWAAGDSGTLIHYDGHAWSLHSAPTNTFLAGIGVAAANDVWAVGNLGTMLHYDGSGWTDKPKVVSDQLWDVDVRATASGSIGWAVGVSGTILRLQNGVWSQVSSPTGNTLRSVDMVDAHSAWAVGDYGAILYCGPLPSLLPAYLPLVRR